MNTRATKFYNSYGFGSPESQKQMDETAQK